jgi:hypothetical protein|nr:MAG TPA: hypothetical protein [Caudoviricetes sp.]
MTNKAPKIFHEITPGEYVDINTAFDRHPALHGIQLETDTESTRVSSAKTGETKTIHTTVGYGLWMSPAMFSALIKILNAAPVNGDHLQAIVSLDLDTTANEAEREALVDYLSGNGYDATLENIAAGYLYDVPNDRPLLLDVVAGTRREYAVTKVWSKSDSPSHVYPGGNRKPAYLNLKTPEETVTITSEKDVIHIEDLEGVIIGNGKWRIMHALEPGGKAPLGGFILERI